MKAFSRCGVALSMADLDSANCNAGCVLDVTKRSVQCVPESRLLSLNLGVIDDVFSMLAPIFWILWNGQSPFVTRLQES
jgi:hypothetical protein